MLSNNGNSSFFLFSFEFSFSDIASPNRLNENPEVTARHQESVYCSGTRRWIEVSLQLAEGMGFRREWFLLDSGAPHSFMVEELAQGVRMHNYDRENKKADIVIEGVPVGFNFQPRDGEFGVTTNINLLGTNFLNNVVVIDDFLSRSLLILKRAPLPEHAV
jgi:hypothetical protein